MKYKRIPKQKDIEYFKIRIKDRVQDCMRYDSNVMIDSEFLRLSKEADLIYQKQEVKQ